MRSNKSLVEIGQAAGVHHSQVSRCERGAFKVISENVQRLCEVLQIAHPKLSKSEPLPRPLKERFDALLEELPGSAAAFACLFDFIESSSMAKTSRKRQRRPST